MRGMLLLAAFLTLIPLYCLGEGANVLDEACKSVQSAINGILSKYKPIFDDYEREGNDLKKDATPLKLDITWAGTDVIFDTPSVKITDKKMIFKIPQVTMKPKDIVFSTPSVKMKRVKTGQYPEFRCEDTWINLPFGGKTKGVPNCTTKWSDTFADVPEPITQEQRIMVDVPEFRFADTEIITGLPEFFMERQHWKFEVPQFKSSSAILDRKPIEDKSTALQSRVAATRADLVKEAGTNIHALFECYRERITNQKTTVSAQFNTAFAQIDGVIQGLKTQGADPTKVTGADGQTTDLLAKRAELLEQRDNALKKFDDALKQLDESEKAAIAKL